MRCQGIHSFLHTLIAFYVKRHAIHLRKQKPDIILVLHQSFFLVPTLNPDQTSKLTMGAVVGHTLRAFVRRTNHYQQKVLSPVAKRQKSSAVNKSSVQATREDGKPIAKADTVALLPLWRRLGLLSEGFNAYVQAQKKRPYTTQVASSLVIYLCGDLSAQKLGGEEYDPWRTLRNMTVGCISSIPSYRW